jgi:DNA-binding transcriptional regulator YiaG
MTATQPWAGSHASSAPWPPEDRAVTGGDVQEFLNRYHLDINLMEAVFSIPSRRSWYDMTTKQADVPVNIPKAVLVRFFSAYPQMLPFYTTETAEELRERLNLSPAAFGLLVGRQEISVRQWSAEREPHKVVVHLLWLIRKSLNIIDNAEPVLNGEEMLADLVRFSFLEWTLRGETPSQRRTDTASTNAMLFSEVLSLVPQNSLARATKGFDLSGVMKALPPSPDSKSEGHGDLVVSPEERHRATKSVRERRKANASLEQMGGTFKI